MMKKLLIIVTLLIATCVAGFAVYWFVNSGHEAMALIRVRRADSAGVNTGQQRPTSIADFELFKQTQADLIKSAFVINSALSKPSIKNLSWVKRAKNPVEKVIRRLKVASPSGTEIIALSLKGPDADDTEDILNAILDAYMDEIITKERILATSKSEHLRAEIRAKKIDLKKTLDQIALINQSHQASSKQIGDIARLQERVEKLDDKLLDLDIEVETVGQEDEERLKKLALTRQAIKKMQVESKKELDELQDNLPSQTNADLAVLKLEAETLTNHIHELDEKLQDSQMEGKGQNQIQILQDAHFPATSGLAQFE